MIGLYGPIWFFLVWIKLQCVVALKSSPGWLASFETVRSSLFVYAGLMLLYVALLVLVPKGRRAMAVRAGMLLVTVTIAFFEYTSYQLFVVTGTVMDWQLTLYFLKNVGETFQVVRAEANPFLWVAGGVVGVGSLAAGAGMVMRRLPPSTEVFHPVPARRRAALLPGGLAVLCLGVACVPARNGPISDGLAREVAIQLAYGAFSGAYDLPDWAVELPGDYATPAISARDTDHPNIVLFMLESTRAVSFTPYTPEVKTAPWFADLAPRSLVVERAFTTYTHTTKSLIAMNCGIHPIPRMEIWETKAPGGIPVPCLAEMLAQQGYHTASLRSATGLFEGLDVLMPELGYKEVVFSEDLDTTGFERANYFGWEDAILLEPTRKFLSEQQGPFFLQLVTGTPHHDYLAPAKRYGRQHFSDDEQTNLYLNSVAYLDHFTAEFVELFKQAGLYDNTLFVFVGDHGEGMGEHWARFHNDCLYDECLSVPLMFHQGDRLTGRVKTSADHLDLVPTILDLAGFDLQPGALTGQSLVADPEERTHFASCWYDFKCIASVRDERKYLHFFDDIPDQVYDLRADPTEVHDLAGQAPGDDAARRAELLDWYHRTWGTYDSFLRDRPADHD